MSSEGALGMSMEEGCTKAVDIAGGDLRASVDVLMSNFWGNSSLIGEDLEFCLAGDRVDRGSGIVAVRSSTAASC